jgi:uncharacterized protein
MSEAYRTVVQLTKMLNNLSAWLEEGVGSAEKRGFDPAVLLEARLAPDMYPLMRQIQAACDGAKFLAARMAGKEPPKHPDTEKTLDEIRARLRAVIEYCSAFKESDFDGWESRKVPLPFIPGKGCTAPVYMTAMNLPNTYFHLSLAYAILRHNGVTLGKMNYLGPFELIDL